ncbi:hypothetical protein EOPP23_05610 [Endozoicomonas sp. OPT23]|uniref:hypothetical protein n=1 Tax=Endozoicomonas sp. OPT23 TaxID=2072845 RepID=UPI00129AC371|nr:hypothetical protein [Endozoicomonas sp. OPT23]MRI32461.1 hypothetical protein [Endozoicomonas sp. OPT23]
MSRRFGYLLLCSSLLAGFLMLPVILPELTAAELTAGRFLVTFLTCLLILPFRCECLSFLNRNNALQWFQRSLFGGVLFCLFLLIVVRELGLLAACLLILLLPALTRVIVLNTWDKSTLSILALLTAGLIILVSGQEYQVATLGNTIEGTLALALAIVCWLVSARLQIKMVREEPLVDSSNQLLLTGLMSLPALLVLLILSNSHWYEMELAPVSSGLFGYWYWLIFSGVLVGIVSRNMWKKLNDSEGRSSGDVAAPAVIMTLFGYYSVQGLLPELNEWLVLIMMACSLIIESGCRKASLSRRDNKYLQESYSRKNHTLESSE